MSTYKSINYNKPIPDLSKSFTIDCPSNTDVWDKPPSTHSFNAPLIYQELTVGTFKSARVTISADWKHKYDQGGLCLVIPKPDGSRRWVKTGIEYLNDVARVSVVAKDHWADWSLRPTLDSTPRSATIEIESNEDGSLWVWLAEENGTKHPMREVTWWGDLDPQAECWVGASAAKPAKEDEVLTVHCENFAVETKRSFSRDDDYDTLDLET